MLQAHHLSNKLSERYWRHRPKTWPIQATNPQTATYAFPTGFLFPPSFLSFCSAFISVFSNSGYEVALDVLKFDHLCTNCNERREQERRRKCSPADLVRDAGLGLLHPVLF